MLWEISAKFQINFCKIINNFCKNVNDLPICELWQNTEKLRQEWKNISVNFKDIEKIWRNFVQI